MKYFIYAILSIFAFIGAVQAFEQLKTEDSVQNFISETRCGWFVNPTPANAWLIDRDGEWTISVQGGYQAEGDYPEFESDQWVETNGHYGYGCACMEVTTDRNQMKILSIISSTAKPLSACRKDKKLKNP